MFNMIKMELYRFFRPISTWKILVAVGAIIFGNSFIAISVPAIIKLLTVQIILHWSFGCLILLSYILTESTMLSMLIGFLVAFKVLHILYTLIYQFLHFRIDRYMLDFNIFQLGIETEISIYARAVLVGIIFVLPETALSILIAQKKIFSNFIESRRLL